MRPAPGTRPLPLSRPGARFTTHFGDRFAGTLTARATALAVVWVTALVVSVLVVSVLGGGAAWAAEASTTVVAVNDLPTVVRNITAWIVGIIATVATLFLTIGGARYVLAGGDPSEVERAKAALRSAAIGYGLALLAPVFMTVLRRILGA